MNKNYFVILLVLLGILATVMVYSEVKSQEPHLEDLAKIQHVPVKNGMDEPTPEQLEKQRIKMEKSERYVELLDAGKYEEALALLKEMWPDSKTTLEDIMGDELAEGSENGADGLAEEASEELAEEACTVCDDEGADSFDPMETIAYEDF